MSVKWEKVSAGDTLYDVRRVTMGNTKMRVVRVWKVLIVSIDHEGNSAVVRWNLNHEERWHKSRVVKLRRTRPDGEG